MAPINISNGQVNSKTMATMVDSLTKMSGFKFVTRIWGGIKLPFGARKPGKSEYLSACREKDLGEID